jgi:hypothetical protein
MEKNIVQIQNLSGDTLTVELHFDGERSAAVLEIDGVKYHLERVGRNELLSNYKVDADPDYQPQADAAGYCYILAPFSS